MSKKELSYLVELFKNFFEENTTFTHHLKEILLQPSKEKSDIIYFFHKILRKSNFYFLKDLCESINTEIPNIYEKIIQIKKTITELENIKPSLEHHLYQYQAFGSTIEIANLNYFLVQKNKTPYWELIQNKEKMLHAPIKSFSKLSWADEKNGLKDFESYYKLSYYLWEINEIYKKMKEYKRSQKEWFLQSLENGFEFENIQNHDSFLLKSKHFSPEEFKIKIYLFDDVTKENFEIIKNIILRISFLTKLKKSFIYTQEDQEKYKVFFEEHLISKDDTKEKIQEKIKEKLIQYKKRKGYFFNTENKSCMFWKYAKFCSEYKKITSEIWKINAFIKNLKEEEKLSNHTKSWALILEKENEKFLLTIPKEKKTKSNIDIKRNNILSARNFITSQKNQTHDSVIYYFESLNLSTLSKLCFSKGNSYLRNKIAKELYNSHKEFVERKEYYKDNQVLEIFNIKMKYEFPKNVFWETCKKILLNFYQSILQLSVLKQEIIIQNPWEFEALTWKNFDSLELFEQKLKEVCYIKKHIPLSEENTKLLVQNFDGHLYKISSYDLSKCPKRKNTKSHTKIWFDFWSEKNGTEKYPIRINPEIKISFIQKKSHYSASSDEKIKSRFQKERFIITTNISENACHQSGNMSGNTQKEMVDFYEHFNKTFEETIEPNLLEYDYMIDIYSDHSLQLSVYQNTNSLKIPTYQLRPEFFLTPNQKWTPIYKNISYTSYDTHPHFYEMRNENYIDLQRVKLINQKIYLDSDISTYLQFKTICAKKKISVYAGKNSHLVWDEKNNALILQNTLKWDIFLYHFDERYEKIESLSKIKKELENLLESKHIEWYFHEDISIQSIQNLQNALCANMIWVLFFLQKTYPGKIYIRNVTLNESSCWWDNLNKKIEEKILQKLASLSLIPSNYKHIFELKEKNILKKLGGIEFLD